MKYAMIKTKMVMTDVHLTVCQLRQGGTVSMMTYHKVFAPLDVVTAFKLEMKNVIMETLALRMAVTQIVIFREVGYAQIASHNNHSAHLFVVMDY